MVIKTNYLLNSTQKNNNIIGKIYLYAKDLEEPKYQFLIEKREKAGLKNLKDGSAFIEHSNNMDDIYDDIEDYNKMGKRRVLIVFDDMISHVMPNKKAQQVLKDLFIRCRKLNISLYFLTQSYFSVPKDVRFNCTHYIIFKIHNQRELQNIAINHSANIDYKDFVRFIETAQKNLIIFWQLILPNLFIKDFKKSLMNPFLKKTIKEQIKILDKKIKQNQADYDLYRQNAKISALSSGKLDKYEYLTDKNLGYKPDPVQKNKFEYSPLGELFTKGLDVNEKQEGLLKRLKNIEGKNKQQLDLIKYQGDRQLDLIGKINAEKIKLIEFYDKNNKE